MKWKKIAVYSSSEVIMKKLGKVSHTVSNQSPNYQSGVEAELKQFQAHDVLVHWTQGVGARQDRSMSNNKGKQIYTQCQMTDMPKTFKATILRFC